MMAGWSQVSVAKRWTLLGVGLSMCLAALHMLWWSPLLDEIDRLNADIQQQEQEMRAVQFTVQTLHQEDQQLQQIRQDLRARFQDIPEEINPQYFRKDVTKLANGSGVTLRAWRPEAMVAGAHQPSPYLAIAIRVEGGFYQAVSFLSGLEAQPWVDSISSVKFMRVVRSRGGVSTTMDITMQVMTPSVFEQVKKLLAI
jgi:Tfp pilus assembly protein PilO